MTSDAQPVQALPPGLHSLHDYARLARRRLPAATRAWIAEGAGDERSVRANVAAFARVALRPRVLVDCRGGSTAVSLLGRRRAHPILLAPVASQRLVHPEGERATAAGAAASDAPMVVSMLASVPLEEVAQRARAGCWLQLYITSQGDERALLRRAEAAGCEAVVVTVDAPVTGTRHRSLRAGFRMPDDVRAVNVGEAMPAAPGVAPGASRVFAALAQAPSWDDVRRLVRATSLPVLVKGVLRADDARIALDCGAAGVIVSNHGGRVLDGAVASLVALPAVRAAVGAQVPVLVDGGIRRGGDVFRALALGASAVLVGRPQLDALAVAGALGVAHVLRLLREELELTMALAGCATVDGIGADAICDATASPSPVGC
jgi:4-hydroxymandelate oxidase